MGAKVLLQQGSGPEGSRQSIATASSLATAWRDASLVARPRDDEIDTQTLNSNGARAEHFL
ncbi:MAG: hypothetical protein OEV60_00610 [Actinomycetota bacterium]|nr:hypothetical protein [Actinomycetota bacterium]MDH5224279.1 hypothetical protein [Actinomycetota bacterium]